MSPHPHDAAGDAGTVRWTSLRVPVLAAVVSFAAVGVVGWAAGDGDHPCVPAGATTAPPATTAAGDAAAPSDEAAAPVTTAAGDAAAPSDEAAAPVTTADPCPVPSTEVTAVVTTPVPPLASVVPTSTPTPPSSSAGGEDSDKSTATTENEPGSSGADSTPPSGAADLPTDSSVDRDTEGTG